jgi:hypothetical protein
MDGKKFLSDFKNYAPEDFAAARAADLASAAAIPDKYRYPGFFQMHGMSGKLEADSTVQASYSRFERVTPIPKA